MRWSGHVTSAPTASSIGRTTRAVPLIGRWAFLITVLSLAGGCMFTRHKSGTKELDQKVYTIVEGKTTREEIVRVFGEPTVATTTQETSRLWHEATQDLTGLGADLTGEPKRAMPTVEDETIYIYEYPLATKQPKEDEVEKLSIFFDRNNRVKAFEFRRAESEMAVRRKLLLMRLLFREMRKTATTKLSQPVESARP